MMVRLLKTLVILSCLIACNKKTAIISSASPGDPPSVEQVPPGDYPTQIQNQRSAREMGLKRPTGWLSLVGLYWLEEGMNSIGASSDNSIVFPRTTIETIGAYQRQGDEIFFGKVEEVQVLHKGEPYLGGPVDIQSYTEVNLGSLYWYVIKRGEKYGIRLKDTLAADRMAFQGIPYFPVDGKYAFDAEVTPTQDSTTITNVLGIQSRVPIAAYISFNVAEQYYSLAALDEGGETFFVIFSDETTSDSTYGGGRFLYPKKPCDSCTQITVLDFNLAQNPPCAFTDFATCPLPPKENHLKFKVEAGEKTYGNH